MAKRKTLPKDFEQLVQTASDEDIKKVLGKCDINAYGGYNKGNALEFPLSEEMMRWLIEQGIDINYVDQYGYTAALSRWKNVIRETGNSAGDTESESYGSGRT